MSDDSDISPARKRKRKINHLSDSSSCSSSPVEYPMRRRKQFVVKELSTDSDDVRKKIVNLLNANFK